MRYTVLKDYAVDGGRFLYIQAEDPDVKGRITQQEFPLSPEELAAVEANPAAIADIAKAYAVELGATLERTQPIVTAPAVTNFDPPVLKHGDVDQLVPARVAAQKLQIDAERQAAADAIEIAKG